MLLNEKINRYHFLSAHLNLVVKINSAILFFVIIIMIVTKLVVHHSATDKATTTINSIERGHRERGFVQIGYHKVIEGSGVIRNGRPESIQGAHARGANLGSLGVCVVGNFEIEVPNTAQIDSLVNVLTKWCIDNGIDHTKIYGHYNVPGGTTPTVCPGRNLRSLMVQIKNRVKNNLS